ncbi:hypothetical protein TruAng_010475 [Truncatella angustata]|nr:hypothetical protein TruAng_010475 [Truncatella angustata]
MLSAAKLAQTLKLAELKTLATLCGVSSSGTKASLAQRLQSSVSGVTVENGMPASEQRILSVDMGIRNLAVSFLTTSSKFKSDGLGPRTPPLGVTVNSWNRVDLTRLMGDVQTDEDAWSPDVMSDMTLDLVQNLFLSTEKSPTHILIERQRFRSGGGSAVQEWTLRVNTLEAMIYSTLKTMKSCGHWKGKIIPIVPKRVGPFWVESTTESEGILDHDKKTSKSKNSKARHKKEKIDLVGKWLIQGEIKPVGQADIMAKSYLQRWQGKRTKKSIKDENSDVDRLQKLDDLADCLLQGLAWIKWQDNQRILISGGPAALLENLSS